MIFLYIMVCSNQKKMIATFCWGVKELWGFEIRYHLKNAIFVYFTLTHPCSELFQYKQTLTSLGASHIIVLTVSLN